MRGHVGVCTCVSLCRIACTCMCICIVHVHGFCTFYMCVCLSLCRIACLLALEMFDECLVMIQRELESDDSNAQLYVLRARLNTLFGHVRSS